jgi:glycosyltransferase involved in cell wall biosynthesis
MKCDYSVIIPAFNEEAFLPLTLDTLLSAMSEVKYRGEVIVVDNNSTDRTADIAREYNTRLVHEPVNQISRARNTGANIALGKYLIFLDADTKIPRGLLNKAISNLIIGDCCGGGAKISTDDDISKNYQRILTLWNKISTTFNVAAGSFIYCLHQGFVETGGFNEKVYVGEEIGYSYRLKSWGKQHNLSFKVITDYPVLTSMRKTEWYSPLQLLMLTIPLLIFPPAAYFKTLCGPWYKRPVD